MSGSAPADWLAEHRDLLATRAPGRALDIACGRGRHALELARLGFSVDAVDRDGEALAALRAAAAAERLAVRAVHQDLEEDARLPAPPYRAIVVFRYLQRALFPAIVRALAPGGLLVFETFTRAYERPMNPAYRLEPGELLRAFAALDVLHHRDGPVEGLVARRP